MGLAAALIGIAAARYYSRDPLVMCGAWCIAILVWAVLCSWRLGKGADDRAKAGLHVGLGNVICSAGAFGLGCYISRYGFLAGGLAHAAIAGAGIFLFSRFMRETRPSTEGAGSYS